MRTEHALMVEEMQSWDKDPIWLAYEEEANKLVWDINQKCARVLMGSLPCPSTSVAEFAFQWNARHCSTRAFTPYHFPPYEPEQSICLGLIAHMQL
jgi:hypothetical protein